MAKQRYGDSANRAFQIALANVSSCDASASPGPVGYLHPMGNDRTRDRFDDLAPRDLVATLRSLERRFGSVRNQAHQPTLAEVIDRPGPSGMSLDTLVAEAARGGALVLSALTTSLDAVEPVIAAPALDPSERVFTDDRNWSIDAAVDTLSSDAALAADRIDDASANALGRAVTVTGAGTTTALGIGQQLARELIAALTASERHLEWLRGQVE